MNKLIEFWKNNPVEGLDFTRFEVQTYLARQDHKWLEGCHGYIQWIFPTDQVSKFNPDAPIIDKEFMKHWLNSDNFANRVNLHVAFEYYYEHLASTVHKWLNPQDHNFLRITRIIRCMNLLELRENAKKLYEWMCELYSDPKYASIIGETTFKFWTDAYNEPIPAGLR